MNAIRKFAFASAAAIALATSSGAAAADYLFDFQFDALGGFAATNIVYLADNLDPSSLTYVSGDVNGATAPELGLFVIGATQRAYGFSSVDLGVPVGAIADIFFSASAPFTAGLTQETTLAGRGVRTSGGISYQYTTGRLTITERVAAVPEPATWAMMLAGFMAVGGALRRRGTLRSLRIAYS